MCIRDRRNPQTKKECLLSTLAKRANIQSLLNSKIMKKSFMLYIIACMSSFFLFVSCEQSELQTTTKPDTTLPVTMRSAIEEDVYKRQNPTLLEPGYTHSAKVWSQAYIETPICI